MWAADKTQLYSLQVYILASILRWAVANQICEALKSVHPKQTLQKSAGKVLEGPCGLDEPWVWTALRDFGQLERHHMDDLHGQTTKVSACMHSIPTFTHLLLRPTCCVFMHKLAKCRHLHEWFRSSTQHWDLTLRAVLTQSCFQRFKVCTAEPEVKIESRPKFHWITADVYMDLCMCVQIRLLR